MRVDMSEAETNEARLRLEEPTPHVEPVLLLCVLDNQKKQDQSQKGGEIGGN
jgi:hypothetical protein